MKNTDVLIIGSSAAGLATAVSGKNNYPEKDFLVIRKEEKLMVPCGIPYIFGTLENSDQNVMPADTKYDALGIEYQVGEAEAINREDQVCRLTDGTEIGYKKLVLATGSTPKVPEWLDGKDLDNVFTIPKNKEVLDNIRSQIEGLQRIVVVGGGFIGVEFSDELNKTGKDVTLAEVRNATAFNGFSRCLSAHESSRSSGKKHETMKVAIASGKGGTGKTTLATNLAALMSSGSRKKHTVLTDLDVEEPNSGIFLKGKTIHQQKIMKEIPEWIPDKCTFCNRCKEVCNFNAIAVLPESVLVFPELCHSCYACVGLCPEEALVMKDHPIGELIHYKVGQLDFIEGKLNIGEQQAVPLISKTIDYTKKNFPDHSIFLYDSPPGTSCPVIESVKEADYVILVAEPTPFGLHDLSLSVKTMRKVGKAFGVVINRHGLGNDDIEQFCSEKQVTILGRIPNMPEIADKYSRGELIIDIPEIRRQMVSILHNIETTTGDWINREHKKAK